jgi:hypothetical protein
MSDFETYDALVVGCGEAGKYMGWQLAASAMFCRGRSIG